MLHESGRGLAPNCQGAVTRQYPSASALPINDMSGIFTDAQTRDLGRRVWMLVKERPHRLGWPIGRARGLQCWT